MVKQNQSIQSEEAVLVWTSCSKTGRYVVWDSTSFNFTTLGDPHNMNLWPRGITKKRMLSNPLAIKEDSYWPKSSALSQSGTVSALPATQKANGRIEYRVTHVQSCFFEPLLRLWCCSSSREGGKAYFLSSSCNRAYAVTWPFWKICRTRKKDKKRPNLH